MRLFSSDSRDGLLSTLIPRYSDYGKVGQGNRQTDYLDSEKSEEHLLKDLVCQVLVMAFQLTLTHKSKEDSETTIYSGGSTTLFACLIVTDKTI